MPKKVLKPQKVSMALDRRKKPGKRTFRKNKFSEPIKILSVKIDASKGKRIYLPKRQFSIFSAIVKAKLKVRKTDTIIFRKYNGKYFIQINSKGHRFYQSFIIKDKKAIKALEYFEGKMKDW